MALFAPQHRRAGAKAKAKGKLTRPTPHIEPEAPLRTPPNEVEPIGNSVGETINFAHYEHFQSSDAKPSDLESLITAERELAKSEMMRGRDWTKVAMAAVIIMIGGAVALFIIGQLAEEGGLPFIPSGGGKETITTAIFFGMVALAPKRGDKKIALADVERRFRENPSQIYPTSHYLGVSKDDLMEVARPFIERLKELGADPAKGPYPKEVVEAFGLRHEIVEDEVNNIIREDLRIVLKAWGVKRGLDDIPGDKLEQIQNDPMGEIARLQQYKPHDKPLRVARLLRRHGFEEVTLDQWFAADFIHQENVKAKVMGFLAKAKEHFGGLPK